MTAALARICGLSGVIYRGTCNCPAHQQQRRRDASRRAAKPQRRVWDSPEHRRLRKFVFQRDRFTCQKCGRRKTELSPRERLICDHVMGLRLIQLQGLNPHDPELCQTLCSTCSGRKDGSMSGDGRRAAR